LDINGRELQFDALFHDLYQMHLYDLKAATYNGLSKDAKRATSYLLDINPYFPPASYLSCICHSYRAYSS
jgi:hypothetical protein